MSVDSEQQVVKLGTSVDMGFCRANKKVGNLPDAALLVPSLIACGPPTLPVHMVVLAA